MIKNELSGKWIPAGVPRENYTKIEAIVGFSPSTDGKKGWQWFLSPSDLFLFLFCFTLRAQTANFTDFPLILWITLWKLSNMGQNYENANAFFSFFLDALASLRPYW